MTPTEITIPFAYAQYAAGVLAEVIDMGKDALGRLYLVDLRGAEANLRRVLTEHADPADLDATVTVRARSLARAGEAIETTIIIAKRGDPFEVAAAAASIAAAGDVVAHFRQLLADVPPAEIDYRPELEAMFTAATDERVSMWDTGRPNPFQHWCAPEWPNDGMIDLPSLGDEGAGGTT